MAADILKIQVYEGGDWFTVSIYNPTQNLLWYEKLTSNTDIALGINQRNPLAMSFASSFDRSAFIASLDEAMTTGSGTVVLNNLRTTTTTTTVDPNAPTTTTTTAASTTTTTAGPTTTTTTEPTTTTTTDTPTTTTTAAPTTTTTTTPGPPVVTYTLTRGGGANSPNATLNIYRYRGSVTTIVAQNIKVNTPSPVTIPGCLDGDIYYCTLVTVPTAQNSVMIRDNGSIINAVLQNGTINYAPDTTFTAQQGHSYSIEVQAWPAGQNPYNTATGGGVGGVGN